MTSPIGFANCRFWSLEFSIVDESLSDARPPTPASVHWLDSTSCQSCCIYTPMHAVFILYFTLNCFVHSGELRLEALRIGWAFSRPADYVHFYIHSPSLIGKSVLRCFAAACWVGLTSPHKNLYTISIFFYCSDPMPEMSYGSGGRGYRLCSTRVQFSTQSVWQASVAITTPPRVAFLSHHPVSSLLSVGAFPQSRHRRTTNNHYAH